MNVRFQLMLPEEDYGELHRLAGETRMAAADLMRPGLRWMLAKTRGGAAPLADDGRIALCAASASA